MTDRPLNFSSGVAGVVTLVTTAETVVATLGGCVTRWPGQTFKITGNCVLTSGTSTTTVTMRIRRKSLTGTLVSDATPQNVTAAAGSSDAYGVYAEDAPGDVTGFTYVLTAQQASADGNGATVYANLTARVD